MLIGTVKEITRHPVKSMQGETLQKANVMDYGLYGDRSHAFKDESRTDKFLTITQCPEMAQYKAAFMGEDSLTAFPPVQIVSPDQRTFYWDDPNLIPHMEQLSKRPLSKLQYDPKHVPLGAIELAHILLITDASLTKLSEMWGDQVDARRFRPNLLVDLIDKQPFSEESFLGKTIRIGSKVTIKFNSLCDRCMIINIDPMSGGKDSSLLKTVAKNRKNKFGVYGSVVQTGEIAVGDEIHVVET